ncbi:MAG: hypothetical protein JRM85_07885 [Nitrososphaerota archaeon]|jgi:hypothetical protein|nr:hypothetical protein [Nitrososphaerota archaeon]
MDKLKTQEAVVAVLGIVGLVAVVAYLYYENKKSASPTSESQTEQQLKAAGVESSTAATLAKQTTTSAKSSAQPTFGTVNNMEYPYGLPASITVELTDGSRKSASLQPSNWAMQEWGVQSPVGLQALYYVGEEDGVVAVYAPDGRQYQYFTTTKGESDQQGGTDFPVGVLFVTPDNFRYGVIPSSDIYVPSTAPPTTATLSASKGYTVYGYFFGGNLQGTTTSAPTVTYDSQGVGTVHLSNGNTWSPGVPGTITVKPV